MHLFVGAVAAVYTYYLVFEIWQPETVEAGFAVVFFSGFVSNGILGFLQDVLKEARKNAVHLLPWWLRK